jgi:hypothetical protein
VAELAVPVQAAVAGAQRHARLAQDVGEEPAGVVAVVGVQVVEEVAAGQLAAIEAEKALDGAGVADMAVRADQVRPSELCSTRSRKRASPRSRVHRPGVAYSSIDKG